MVKERAIHRLRRIVVVQGRRAGQDIKFPALVASTTVRSVQHPARSRLDVFVVCVRVVPFR